MLVSEQCSQLDDITSVAVIKMLYVPDAEAANDESPEWKYPHLSPLHLVHQSASQSTGLIYLLIYFIYLLINCS